MAPPGFERAAAIEEEREERGEDAEPEILVAAAQVLRTVACHIRVATGHTTAGICFIQTTV